MSQIRSASAAAVFVLAAGMVATPATHAATVPAIDAASLNWNLKRTFSSYITGPIAKGKIEVVSPANVQHFGGFLEHNPPSQRFQPDDASLKYGFAFNPANSTLDAGGKGVLAFDGAVRWTGHKAYAPQGQEYGLDIQFSDVKVHVDGTAGKISVDYWVRGTNITGDQSALNERGDDAVFATFTLSEPITPAAGKTYNTSPDGITKGSGATTTITEEGAKKVMIGFYEPIEYDDALFDLTVSFAGSGQSVPAPPAATPAPAPTTTTCVPVPVPQSGPTWKELSSTDKGSPAERITTGVTLAIAAFGLLGVLSGFSKFAFERFLKPRLPK
ncbi:HtaA domain-containing protein [Corynebacterium sp. TA-R-1]|uniref:HtaA domain-containing protein n=1 Tax=Corynebacterium stercoris TaxID=2943490 RepID=A0ABT1G0Z1_9CORY|nr:HtaA domain-containing protein [Corynebacterium stercoris]MCP1387691.1 HtaA domain-containing protein [Corynebacterium stercoris]